MFFPAKMRYFTALFLMALCINDDDGDDDGIMYKYLRHFANQTARAKIQKFILEKKDIN